MRINKTPRRQVTITSNEFGSTRELSVVRKNLPRRDPVFGPHEFPLLSQRVARVGRDLVYDILPGVSATPGFDGSPEVVESYDVPPDLTHLNRPIHVRIERRGDRLIHCSIFLPTLQDIARILVDYANLGKSVPRVLEEPDVLFRIETDVTRAAP